MAEDSSDVIMYLKMESGFLPAEGQSSIDTSDEMVNDFVAGSFFHVRDFSFDMGLDDADPTSEPIGKAIAPTSTHGWGSAAQSALVSRKDEMAQRRKEAKKRGKFAGWKLAKGEEKDKLQPFPLRMGEFSITRVFDCASPILLAKCCNSDSFVKAALVKRRTIGDEKLHGYIRMDFESVLITHLDWKNTEPMTEELKFVFRKIQVRYRVTVFDERTNMVYMEKRQPVEWEYDIRLVKKA